MVFVRRKTWNNLFFCSFNTVILMYFSNNNLSIISYLCAKYFPLDSSFNISEKIRIKMNKEPAEQEIFGRTIFTTLTGTRNILFFGYRCNNTYMWNKVHVSIHYYFEQCYSMLYLLCKSCVCFKTERCDLKWQCNKTFWHFLQTQLVPWWTG